MPVAFYHSVIHGLGSLFVNANDNHDTGYRLLRTRPLMWIQLVQFEYVHFFSGLVREKRSHSFPRFYGLCSQSERNRLDACLRKKGQKELDENHLVCTKNKIVVSCFYLVSCEHVHPNSAVYNYTCGKVYHQRSYVAKCCGVLGCWLGSSYHPGTSMFESTL